MKKTIKVKKGDKVTIVSTQQTGIVTKVVNLYGRTQVWIRDNNNDIHVYEDERFYEKVPNKYKWFEFAFEPVRPGHLGSDHKRWFKAIDYDHALKQAKKVEDFKVDGQQVYKLVRLVREGF